GWTAARSSATSTGCGPRRRRRSATGSAARTSTTTSTTGGAPNRIESERPDRRLQAEHRLGVVERDPQQPGGTLQPVDHALAVTVDALRGARDGPARREVVAQRVQQDLLLQHRP